MAKSRKQRTVTRKHLARQERERIQNRYILFSAIGVFVIVILLIAYGFLEEGVLQPQRPVAEVEDETITVGEFQERVRYERFQLVRQYLNTYQFMQSFEDESTQSFFQSNLQQIAFQLDPPTSLGRSVLDTMIENILIRKEAEKLGIRISPEEVDAEIEAFLGFFPRGTPTSQPTREIPATSTLSPTQLALLLPTPTPSPMTSITETVDLTSTAVVSESLVPSVMPTLVSDEVTTPTPALTSTPLPSATPYTRESFESDYQQVLNILKDEIDFNEQALRESFEDQLYRQKFREIVTEDIQPVEEQVWARHILVEDEETANDVLTRLENGEDFAEIAEELSTDPGSAASGGDLGWFGQGRMVAEFEETAFDLEIGEISEPVESTFGWHIIQVLGHEERPLGEAAFEQLRNQEFQDWLDNLRETSEVVIFDDWQDVVPGEPSIPTQLLPQQQP
jgi:parvulin-like peptidyl-prolyl isomerase